MADAFRQLEALNSLDDPEEYVPAPAKILPITDPPAVTLNSSASPEQDFVLYKDMVQELEANEEAQAYSEVLDELGESALQMDDTYSQIMTELGGPTILRPRPKEENSPQRSNNPEGDEVVEVPSNASSSNEQILAEALKEALAEVQLNNPRIREMSLLDDKEIMREIEAVFDAGNAKLLQSLEEVRREQEKWVASKAEAKLVDGSDNETRLQNAEQSVERILKRVDMETSAVEQAVSDLKAANSELEQDFLWKLKRGGLPKQAALIGFLLLSVRSILESLQAVTSSLGDSEGHLSAALIQGVIALVCAAIFFLL